MTRGYMHFESSGDPADLARWADRIGAEGWVILESYPTLTFERWTAGQPLPQPGAEFAGRIFGQKAELRWTRDAANFHVCLFEDIEGGAGLQPGPESPAIQPFDVESRHYYALGYWTDAEGRYWEPILPSTEINYPLGPGKDNDRPRFLVHEYYRPIPDALSDNLTEDEIEDIANQPSLAAYRLVALDAGKDEN